MSQVPKPIPNRGMVMRRWFRRSWRSVIIVGFVFVLAAWTPLKGCKSAPGFGYMKVGATIKLDVGGVQFDAKNDPGYPNSILLMYRVKQLWNKSGKSFTFKNANFRACPDLDDGAVHLLPGGTNVSDKDGTTKLADNTGVDVNIPLVFHCRRPPGSTQTEFDLEYHDASVVSFDMGGAPQLTASATSVPNDY